MSLAPEPPRPSPPSEWFLSGWRLLLVLGIVEFVCFDLQTSRHHTWVYPRWNDQIQYLTESYTGFEDLRAHPVAGWWHAFVNPSAQGTLHDFLAIAMFSVAGPSRSAALALNMLALLAWQAALFAVVRRRHPDSRGLAWSAAMLPLALRWPWNDWAGSTIDFRLDHLTMCALGLTLCCGLLTDGFRSRRASLGFGLSVGGTLLLRFLTGTYFVLIFLALLVWLLSAPERRRRLGNLFLAAGVAAALAGPIFWLNRTWVWNYYWIGHFTGPESALRNPHMGFGRSLGFVWGHLAQDHLGAFFWWLVAAVTAVLALGACLWRREPANRPPQPAGDCVWGGIFLLAPALVLTLHQQKSEIVVGALVPGAIVLVLAVWEKLRRLGRLAWLPGALSGGVVVASLVFFISRIGHTGYDAAFATDARKVNTLADYIYDHARAAKLASPRVGVDQVTDCLDGQVLRVICYERHRVWVPFIMTLPTGIAEEKESVLMERLTGSDFVFLTESGPVGGWPYDRQMRALLPRTQAWCEEHLRLVERFNLFGHTMVLYQRREIP